MVIWLPCLLALFCVLVGVANLWLARVELENSLEAAALSAVKEWGDAGGGDTANARDVGVQYAGANIIRGQPVVIGPNYNAAKGPNQNDVCDPTDETVSPPNGNLVFGAIDDSDPDDVVFDAGAAPSPCGGGPLKYGVRAQAIVPVQALQLGFLGTVTQYCVQAKATAEYDCTTGRVRLIRVDQFICP
jgi:hypothetical protein